MALVTTAVSISTNWSGTKVTDNGTPLNIPPEGGIIDPLRPYLWAKHYAGDTTLDTILSEYEDTINPDEHMDFIFKYIGPNVDGVTLALWTNILITPEIRELTLSQFVEQKTPRFNPPYLPILVEVPPDGIAQFPHDDGTEEPYNYLQKKTLTFNRIPLINHGKRRSI